jgi:hypothetical protein
MTLQIIKSIDGRAEYILLPFNIYNAFSTSLSPLPLTGGRRA